MAQLKDLIVNGVSQLIGNAYVNKIQITTLNALTSADSTTYSAGTSGQVLKTNGTNAYWAADSNSDVNVTQTITTGNANYRLLFSNTADDTTHTETARKAAALYYNPSTKALTISGGSISATTFNGYLNGTAVTATQATHAATANSATTASNATTAGFATTASQATHAATANSATTATEATHAATANSATTASNATTAAYAATASQATHSATANTAATAGFATTASQATHAATANTATTASNAVTAGFAITASMATTAGNATDTTKVAKTGDTMTGPLTLKPGTGEGGQINLNASSANTGQAGISIDQYNSTFRIFGIPSADGSTITGVGTPLVIDPYAKTITGGYTITGSLNGNANTATTASRAGTAGYAITASQATHSASANTAGTAGFATTASVAVKLGTASVGNAINPIYLNAGTPTVGSLYRYHYDANEDWASYSWHKVASTTCTGAYQDKWITFLVSAGSDAAIHGILTCRLRSTTDNAYELAQCCFVNRTTALPISTFKVIYYTSGNNLIAELWCQMRNRWAGYCFRVLDSGGNRYENGVLGWELANTINGHGSASYSSGTVINATDAPQYGAAWN